MLHFLAGSANHEKRSQSLYLVESLPLVDLRKHIGAHDEPELGPVVFLRERPDGLQRSARNRQNRLHSGDRHLAEVGESELTHARAVLEGRKLLVEGVLEHRHHEQTIEAPDCQGVSTRQDVRDVRRIEAASVDSDDWHGDPLWINFARLPMPSRLRALTQPVDLTHDGDRIEANAGESLAHALLGADRLALTRSPKLHRPRGPYCLRAACEGCLVRVDGIPNVMACRHRVRGGEAVETQNVIGSRELDLLAATDFMFPHGVDHHRLFAGVRGLSTIVPRLARRIAGLGRLPDDTIPTRSGEVRDVSVLVVGGGGAGLAAAAELGARAMLVDDGLELGGVLRLLAPEQSSALVIAARASGAELCAETTAAGIFPGPDGPGGRLTVVLAGAHPARAVFARSVILATGEHDPPPDFAGNDLPGVLSVRAGLSLLQGGILPDRRTVLVGSGPLLARARLELGQNLAGHFRREEVVRAEGRLRLRNVFVRQDGAVRKVRAGALLYSAPASPAFELAVQAGAALRFEEPRGYVPAIDAEARAAENVWCAGRVRGHLEDPAADGRVVARRVALELSAR